MRILAIETAVQRGSIALLEQRRQQCELVHEALLPVDQRSAQSLAPALADALQRVDWPSKSVDLVAVANGPGSFTGLRIAVTTAKTFAYAVGARLVACNTLRVLVEQLPANVTDACAVMDARRRQLFAARFRRATDGQWNEVAPCQIIDRDTLVSRLSAETILTGPELERLTADLPLLQQQPRATPDCWLPRASTLGRLACVAHDAGQWEDLFGLLPQYYRLSYAEEKTTSK